MTWNMQSAVVPVTGGASGIGFAICKQLRAEGAIPLLLDRDEARLQAAAAEIYPDAKDTRYAYTVDVRDSRSVDACMDEIARTHGPVTHAVASAGTGGPSRVLTMTDEDWHRVIDVNLHGAMYLCRAAARQLAASKRPGSIVTIASLAGLRAKDDRVSYSASKAGVVNMTRAFALDLGPMGIRANAVAPGVIDTPIQEGNRSSFDTISAGIPLRRIGTPEDVANAVLFLLSDLSSYITGHTLVIDGGMLAKYR